MSKIAIFFATGFEEIEALTVVDILRRAGETVEMVSVTGEKKVTSSHNVTVEMDLLFQKLILMRRTCWCCRAECRARRIWKPLRR